MPRFAGLIITFAAVAVIAAAAAAPAAAPNPCKLVTAADAKAALGAPVGKPTLAAAGLYQLCTYSASTRKLVVLTRRLSKPDFIKSAKANPKPVAAIGGIGSAAYSVGGGASLLVWKKGTEVTFSIFGSHAPLHAEEQLAKRVTTRL
jgi:hypothetical protein